MMLSVFLTSDDIRTYFLRFGSVTVDWPHKNQNKGCIPPKGTYVCSYSLSDPFILTLILSYTLCFVVQKIKSPFIHHVLESMLLSKTCLPGIQGVRI